jgi:hypothetical protein
MVSAIDWTKPIYGLPTTQSVRDNFQIANEEISAIQELLTGDLGFISQGDADLRYLQLIGGVLTGDLTGLSIAGSYLYSSGSVEAVGTVQGSYINSTGNVNAAGAHNGGAVNVSGEVRAGGSMMVASGTIYVADNYTYYSGRNPSTGNWQWVQANQELMHVDTAGGLWNLGNYWCSGQIDSSGGCRSNNGRLMSIGSNNNPSVTCWDTAMGYAMGMCIQTGNAGGLFFAGMDGGGNVAAWYGYIGAGSVGCNNATVSFTNYNGAYGILWGDNGAMSVPGSAWKPGGGSWADSSDIRIKTVIGDYTSGLDEILALRPIRYNLKDNWRFIDGRNAEVFKDNKPAIQTPHQFAVDGTEYIGFVAQELETIMPETIKKMPAIIDDKLVDDLRIVDITAVSYALVNAVKTLHARIVGLEARV